MGWWFIIKKIEEEKLEAIKGGGASAIWIGIAIPAAIILMIKEIYS